MGAGPLRVCRGDGRGCPRLASPREHGRLGTPRGGSGRGDLWGGGPSRGIDRADAVLLAANGTRRRSRTERVVVAVRGGARSGRLPAEPERRPLRGAGGRGGGGREGCAVRLIDVGSALSRGRILRTRADRSRRRLRLQPAGEDLELGEGDAGLRLILPLLVLVADLALVSFV